MRRLTWVETSLIVGAFFVAVFVFASYFGTFGAGSSGLSHDPESWAEFGEYVGGSLGAFFGFFAFVGILVTLWNQRTQSNLDEIQRLMGRTSDRIDQILHSEPLQIDPLRREQGQGTTAFDDLQGLAAIALIEGLIPDAENRVTRIDQGRRCLRYEWTRLNTEFTLLVNLLDQYTSSGGSKVVSASYRAQHELTAAYLRAVEFRLPLQVEQYVNVGVLVEQIRRRWTEMPMG